MMSRIHVATLGCCLLLTLVGCRGILSDSGDAEDITTYEWDLAFIEQSNGRLTDVGVEGMLISFLDDGRVEGRSYDYENPSEDGNTYASTYEVGPGPAITISQTNLRTNAQIIPHRSRWLEYLRALTNAQQYEVAGRRLRIYYDGIEGTQVLHYQASPYETPGDEGT